MDVWVAARWVVGLGLEVARVVLDVWVVVELAGRWVGGAGISCSGNAERLRRMVWYGLGFIVYD